MATTAWQKVGGDPDGNWSDSAHWDNGIPRDGDDVVLPILSGKPAYTITLDVDTANLGSITIAQPKDPGPVDVTLDIKGFTLNVTGGTLLTAGHIRISGGTFNDIGGLALNSASDLIGFGTLNVLGHYTGTGTLQASGGVLHVFGSVDSGVVLSIDSTTSSTLEIENGATSAAAISITDGNQTLAIGSLGNLTINAAESVTSGTITLDGGTLTDTFAITIASGATFTGDGSVTAGSTSSTDFEGGATATFGTLHFTSEVNLGAASTFHIAAASGNALKFDAQVGTASIHPTITFDNATGTASGEILDLETVGLTNFFGHIAGFTNNSGGDENLFDGIKVTGANHATLGGDNVTLHVFNSSSTEIGTVTFTSSMAGNYFHVINTDEIVICFMPGTRICTPAGTQAVETFKPGDLVLTVGGAPAPVRWVGRQTVSRIFGDPLRVLPIRIKAGALGNNMPVRDLLLSPDHALLVDGVLMQAGALVNGTSVVRESDVPEIYTYYHIELDDHSLVLAEGVPAETFVDNVDRLAFDNWDEHEALYPQGRSIVEMDYPRAKAYRQVPRVVRERLAARVLALSADMRQAA